MAKYSQKWHNGTSSKARSTETFDGLAAIQAQLNNLGREIKKVNEKVYAAQVGCELCKGPHYTKDCPLKEEGNTLEEAYYTQQTLEESLTKFMAESAKRHEENSNIIKEIRASTDAAIRNQGASIKTLEIQIGQMSKVLQERGIRGLLASTEPNPRDHVKSISTTKADSSEIRHMESQDLKILEAYDHTLPQKEKDPRSFTLPCFDKSLVDLGASVSVMPFSFYTNLGLGILSHTRRGYESIDPLYGNYIELNDLDTPIELETNQDVDFEPTIVNEPDNVKTSSKCYYKMKFSCTIGYKNVNADFIPFLSIDLITKSFYYSIIKDKDGHEGKSLVRTLIDIPVSVGNFSILAGFITIDDVDITRDVALGMPFFMKYVSCQMVMKKFAHGDKCEQMMEE
ncbi:retrovirus-related pol polyprotein from transposon TNT 1-94 [Tanacetum coccineum]